MPPPPAELPAELAAAFLLLVSVVGDRARAWQICQTAGFGAPDATVDQGVRAAAFDLASPGGQLPEVDDRLGALGLAPQQLRAAVEALTGVLLGASFGSALALRLIQLRSTFHLSLPECLRLTAAVWPQVMYEGDWAEWYPLLIDLADGAASLSLELQDRLSLLEWLSICGRWLGVFDETQGWIDRALQLANRAPDPVSYARFTLTAGTVHRLLGRLLSAESTLAFACSQFTKLNDLAGLQRCQIEMAQLALEREQPDKALALLEEHAATAQVSALRGEALLMRGEYQQAIALLMEITVASKPNLGRAQALLSQAYLQAGRLDEARETAAHAVEILQSTADILGCARALALRGAILLEIGAPAAAIVLLEQAHTRQQTTGDHAGQRRTLTLLLRAYPVLIEQALDRRELDAARQSAIRLIECSQILQQQAPHPAG